MRAGYRLVVANRLSAFSEVRHPIIRREGEMVVNHLLAFFERVSP